MNRKLIWGLSSVAVIILLFLSAIFFLLVRYPYLLPSQKPTPQIDNFDFKANKLPAVPALELALDPLFIEGAKEYKTNYYKAEAIRYQTQQQIQQFLAKQDFAGLEAYARTMLTGPQTYADDGAEKRHIFYRAFDETMPEKPLVEWNQQYPKSGAAKIALAQYYQRMGWAKRGKKLARDVINFTYVECFQKAVEILKSNPTLVNMDPEYALTGIASDVILPKSDIVNFFKAGQKINPTYLHLYQSFGYSLLYRWHGKKGDLKNFANWSAGTSASNPTESAMRYVWATEGLHWIRIPLEEYLSYELSWPRLKAGYIALGKQRHLDINRINFFCWLSVVHQDKATAKVLFDIINDDEAIDYRLWNGRDHFMQAKAWANQKSNAFFKTETIDPYEMDNSPAYQLHQVAYTLHSLGHTDGAIAKMQEGLEIDPHYAQGYSFLGECYKTKQLWSKAIEAFLQSADILPNAEVYQALANAYQQAGKTADAEKYYWKAVQIDESKAIPLQSLITFYQQGKQYEKALKVCEKLISVAPVDNYVYYITGDIYARLNLLPQASAAFQKALTIDPTNPYAKNAHYFLEQHPTTNSKTR